MSEALLCLTENFYSQDLCKENCLHFMKFPDLQMSPQQNVDKSQSTDQVNKLSEKSPLSSNHSHKGILPQKREATNMLVACVKRRDGIRSDNAEVHKCLEAAPKINSISDASVSYCENISCIPSDGPSLFTEFSNSSMTDSGIGNSKNCSPAHSIDSSSPCLSEEMRSSMDVEDSNVPLSNAENSVETSAVEDLDSLCLSDASLLKSPKDLKPPTIQSLFKNVPSLIYFSTKDEAVISLPESSRKLLKWKLSTITPAVIKEAVTKAGFVLVEAETTEDWIGTWGKHLKCSTFRKIQKFQKVNHYPGGFHMGRKDRLWQNYSKLAGKHGECYSFFPETYVLPADLKTLKEAWEKLGNDNCWIIKPCASARGCGVKVIHKWSQVPKVKPFIIQRYISDPYLIDGSKFDLRLYVLVPSIEPLRVYIYEDGLVRFASEKYSLANKSFANRFIHLTNYSVNKKSSTYASNDDETLCQGHKWSLKAFWAYMSNCGIDVTKIQDKITDMIIKTVICTEAPISRLLKTYAQSHYNCFELFGFDIMLDRELHPWLLEVNISPSLHTKSVLDSNVKGPMVKDMLNIAGFEVPDESGFCSTEGNRHRPLHRRWLSDEERKKHAQCAYTMPEEPGALLSSLTADDVRVLRESEDELSRSGGFRRVYPSADTRRYLRYFEHQRYYNALLDAWERRHAADRSAGIEILKELHEKFTSNECEISGGQSSTP